jgi:hypothetical protein
MGSCHSRTRMIPPPVLRRQRSAALRNPGMSGHLGAGADRPLDPPCCATPAVSYIGADLAKLNCADSFRPTIHLYGVCTGAGVAAGRMGLA